MRFVNSLIAAIAVAGLTVGISNAQEKSQSNEEGAKVPYLGLAVGKLHPAFASHLTKTLTKGQGVVVERVAKDSPAEKAGLQRHDIITMYDDQKIFSVEQMLHLIQADKIGNTVKLQLVRGGEKMTASVTLGEHPNPLHLATEFEHWVEDELAPFRVSRKTNHAPKEQSKAEDWESFDSMTLSKLDNGKYRAEMSYLGKDDKMHQLQYEGTREEIRKKILADKELRDSERNHLLRGLDMREDIEFDFPEVDVIPGRGVFIEVPQPEF